VEAQTQKALFAAGCFWGVQYYFDHVPGVIKTTVGYSGGTVPNPTYDVVASRHSGHAETTLIEFDPQKVSYETLLKQFFRMHNPTLLDSDGINVGPEYRSAIFYVDDQQKKLAEKVLGEIQKRYKEPIVTEISPAKPFYRAERLHQKFTERTGIGMCHIAYASVE
jgi:peptide-methionine (S)-S-oxide reductase